jgi:glycerophosphoryl diester phosphodiesterase
VYAHRGDRSKAEDNTLDAYRLAVEAGADGIELDVRCTADGVLIMAHDPAHGDLPPFCDLTFVDLRAAAPSVPTFEETLRAIPGDVFLNVEVKNTSGEPGFDPDRRTTDQSLELVKAIDDPERILLSSFDPESVARAGIVHPDVLSGLLVSAMVPMEAAIDAARTLGVAAVHPPMTSVAPSPTSIIGAIHDAGFAVVVWNANTPEQVDAIATAGVDVIITDDPGMARSVLDQR